MTLQPGELRLGVTAEAKTLKFTGVGDYYRARLRRQIPCPECGVEVTMGSITAHRCCMHGTEPAIYWNPLRVSQTEQHLQVYNVIFLWTKGGAPAHSPVVRSPLARGMDFDCILAAINGGISLES